MSYARQLLDTYQGTVTANANVLAAAIDALSDCAQACTADADADADLGEQNLAEMVKCIRLCLDCADVCTATIALVSRQADYDANVTRPLLEACVAICTSCGERSGGGRGPGLSRLPDRRRSPCERAPGLGSAKPITQ